ncbi:hypothetical protein HPB48_008081 [Haemaphysalis longicornis]|uniref:Peptidase M16 N-terminal domain-containing protein n=1 Tax=Haemaphysalis longicornis TaxID=44386 RepID=A0A9J6GWU7_HAELO|nr:hypothetical protein HPB48_008081 [Haemaphysalis longicornis]
MAAKITRIPGLNLHAARAFAAQAAAKPQSQAFQALPKQDVETSTLPNGLTVTTLENYSPITRLAIVVKAGARYEDGHTLGITHTLRNAAGLVSRGGQGGSTSGLGV